MTTQIRAADAVPATVDRKARCLPRHVNFTREALASVRCTPGRPMTIVYDTKARGLQYVVRASGARAFYWYGRVKGDGVPVRHHIGGDEFPIDAARKRAVEATVKSKNGINPNGELRDRRAAQQNRRRLGELWQSYVDGFLSVRAKPKTRATHVSLWNVWLSPWADRAVDAITGDDVRALHATIAKGKPREKTKGRGKGASNLGGKRTANKAIALLRRLFNFNKVENPIRPGVVEMFREHSRERYLSPPEMKRFFEALQNEPDKTARDFFELALYTGARRGNVQSMRWDELDLDAMRWTIPAEKTKAGKSVDVPLPPPALELLARRQLENDAKELPSEFVLWSDRGTKGHIMEPRYALDRICAAAKITNLTIHDLRRTLGSWQAGMGASLPIIGRSLGHANQASTAIYARMNLDPVRASVAGAVAAMRHAAGLGIAVDEPKAKGGKTPKKPK